MGGEFPSPPITDLGTFDGVRLNSARQTAAVIAGPMPRPDLRSLRDVAIVVGIALLVLSGSSACGPVAARPDGETPARVADLSAASEQASTYLVLRLNERRLYLMKHDAPEPLGAFPIAIGRDGHETPTGQFQVEDMIVHPDFDKIDPTDRGHIVKRIPPGPDNPLGERWMQITHGEGWTLGIHGTPHPELLGQRVSGGCIRMRNADVIRVYDSVRLGTKVIVTP
jgi:lipoprotein-anchoring transpeptidase ErfK/SrfK